MNIFYDIHTYLIISFVGMLFLLFKLVSRKVNSFISKEIVDIERRFNDLRERKQQLEQELSDIKQNLYKEQNIAIDNIKEAEQKSKDISDQTILTISRIIEEKNQEQQIAIQKIYNELSVELQRKLVDEVIKKIVSKIKLSSEICRELHNNAIASSLDMLNSLAGDDVSNKEKN